MKKYILREIDMTEEQRDMVKHVAKTFKMLPYTAYHVAKVCNFNLDDIYNFIRSDVLKPIGVEGLPDINNATDLILSHIQKKSLIRIVGDYDADGVTSTALMYKTLLLLGARVDFYLPDRRVDGYGLNVNIVNSAVDDKVDLIVTVDNGISAYEPIKVAREKGIDVVVTDHHVPPEILPPANACIDPLLHDSTYKNKSLAGVGVAYKLAQHLMSKAKIRPSKEFINEVYTLVAIGTVCDVMDISTVENRMLVKKGMNAYNFEGALQQFKQVASKLTIGTIGFGIGPRINACGRMDSADIAIQFLLGDVSKLDEMNQLNEDRQKIQKEATEGVLNKLQDTDDNIIIEVVEGVDEGVTGLVANDVKENKYRPTIIFNLTEKGVYKASGRSIDEFDMFAHVSKHLDLLEGGGGHSMACGLVAKNLEQIAAFKDAMLKEVSQYIFPSAEEVKNTIKVDFELDLDKYSLDKLSEDLNILAPFGTGNRSPKYLIRNRYITLQTRKPKGYIVTDVKITDVTQHSTTCSMWNNESMPDLYSGRADIVLTYKSGKLSIDTIELLEPEKMIYYNTGDVESPNVKTF